MKTQGEEDHLQAEERGLGRNQPCQHLGRGRPASRTTRTYVSAGYALVCGPWLCKLKQGSPLHRHSLFQKPPQLHYFLIVLGLAAPVSLPEPQ